MVLSSDASIATTSACINLKGSAVNQDGRSSGLTAPNGPSQSRLIQASLKAADLNSRTLSYVAVHGTGKLTEFVIA